MQERGNDDDKYYPIEQVNDNKGDHYTNVEWSLKSTTAKNKTDVFKIATLS